MIALAGRAALAMHAHPVAAVVTVALLLRLATTLVAHAVGPAYLVPDERQYVELAAVVAAGQRPSDWDPTYGASLWDSTFAYTGTVALLFWLLEPTRLLGMLLAGLLGAVTAGLTARLLLQGGTPRQALAGGLLVAALPSQVFWSSVALRESMVWAALAALGLASALAAFRRFALSFALAATGLLALAHLRGQTMVAAAVALVLAAALVPGDRLRRVGGALLLALVVPMTAGLGVGGSTLVTASVPALSNVRDALGAGAASSFTAPAPATPARGTRPSADPSDSGALELVRRNHPQSAQESAGVAANLRALPEGAVAFLLRPLPWESARNTGVALARAENLLWYVLYLAAAPFLLAWNSRRGVLAFPVCLSVVLVTINALAQGNVGTAFRHRGQLAWAVAVLAVVGTSAWRTSRQNRTEASASDPCDEARAGDTAAS